MPKKAGGQKVDNLKTAVGQKQNRLLISTEILITHVNNARVVRTDKKPFEAINKRKQ